MQVTNKLSFCLVYHMAASESSPIYVTNCECYIRSSKVLQIAFSFLFYESFNICIEMVPIGSSVYYCIVQWTWHNKGIFHPCYCFTQRVLRVWRAVGCAATSVLLFFTVHCSVPAGRMLQLNIWSFLVEEFPSLCILLPESSFNDVNTQVPKWATHVLDDVCVRHCHLQFKADYFWQSLCFVN